MKRKSKVSVKLPDPYAGQLNIERIAKYQSLFKRYGDDLSNYSYNELKSIIREVFCEGADWYKQEVEKCTKQKNVKRKKKTQAYDEPLEKPKKKYQSKPTTKANWFAQWNDLIKNLK